MANKTPLSLSARRAWIEMRNGTHRRELSPVALRKESVDRNLSTMQIVIIVMESLSARRAWIEIVDPDKDTLTDDGRSPQGERG